VRLVADTNVVVSALFWRGAPRGVLEAARHDKITLFTSGALLDELEDVLKRPKFAERLQAAGVSCEQLVLGYAAFARLVAPAKIAPVIGDDPDDDAVLACAIGASADLIVSGDHHLQRLAEFRGIGIISASELLTRIGRD